MPGKRPWHKRTPAAAISHGRAVQPLNEGFAIPSRGNAGASFRTSSEQPSCEPGGGNPKPYTAEDRRQIAFMENPERCGKALRKDVSAATTLGPNASRRQLWADLAGKAGYPDPFFLQPSMIYEVMGALKLAGFRSAQLYLDVAKAQHISQGHMWSDQLQQSYRAAVRSCQRFLGSPKQAAPLPLDKLALKSRWPREAPFGPHGHHCWLAGGFSGR
jgi:hypothetical protein